MVQDAGVAVPASHSSRQSLVPANDTAGDEVDRTGPRRPSFPPRVICSPMPSKLPKLGEEEDPRAKSFSAKEVTSAAPDRGRVVTILRGWRGEIGR